ncbi:MAG TPA: hypothetical protein VKT80_08530 [Chloroflexota bacterium]|nr:hypothetical protein [Chloroflexota bacterium]
MTNGGQGVYGSVGQMPRRTVLPADYLRGRALGLRESARYGTITDRAIGSGDLPDLISKATLAPR